MGVVKGTISHQYDIRYLAQNREYYTYIALVPVPDEEAAVVQLRQNVPGLVKIESVAYKGLVTQPVTEGDTYRGGGQDS